MKELERELSKKEKEEKAAADALTKAHETRKAALAGIRKANEAFQRLRAQQREGVDTESYSFRKKVRAAEEELAAAKKADEESAERVFAAQKVLDAAKDEVVRVKGELAGPRLKALEEKVAESTARMREAQAVAVAEFKKLVAMHAEAEGSLPPRVVMKRAINRYLVVRPKDPVMREAMGKSIVIPGVERGCFHLEYYKAMKQTGPGGKLEFPLDVEQDFSPPDENDRDQVEILKGSPKLPEPLEAIKAIDLGLLLSENGGFRRLDFNTIETELWAERKEAADASEKFVG